MKDMKNVEEKIKSISLTKLTKTAEEMIKCTLTINGMVGIKLIGNNITIPALTLGLIERFISARNHRVLCVLFLK